MIEGSRCRCSTHVSPWNRSRPLSLPILITITAGLRCTYRDTMKFNKEVADYDFYRWHSDRRAARGNRGRPGTGARLSHATDPTDRPVWHRGRHGFECTHSCGSTRTAPRPIDHCRKPCRRWGQHRGAVCGSRRARWLHPAARAGCHHGGQSLHPVQYSI